jgi:hypothetical protein
MRNPKQEELFDSALIPVKPAKKSKCKLHPILYTRVWETSMYRFFLDNLDGFNACDGCRFICAKRLREATQA